MIKNILLGLLMACSSDVSIMKRADADTDNEETAVDSQPASEPGEPTSEPSSDISELTIGFAEVSLTQIACPACMGVSSEFEISANLKLHHPTNGGYYDQMVPVGTCVTQELGSYVSSTPLEISGLASFNFIVFFFRYVWTKKY